MGRRIREYISEQYGKRSSIRGTNSNRNPEEGNHSLFGGIVGGIEDQRRVQSQFEKNEKDNGKESGEEVRGWKLGAPSKPMGMKMIALRCS